MSGTKTAGPPSDLMAPFLLLLVLLAEAASTSDQTVEVRLGENATLPCRSDDSSIRAVEWSRPDLEPDTVLLYRDGRLDPYHQHPEFKERVDLVDRYLKGRDVSLTLKNVNINDNGTYECRVKTGDSGRRKRDIINSDPIRTIRTIKSVHLHVTGEKSAYSNDENPKNGVPEAGPSSPGDRHHGLVGVPVGLVLVAVAAAVSVAGVLMYKRHKDKRPGPPAAADDDDEASGEKFV